TGINWLQPRVIGWMPEHRSFLALNSGGQEYKNTKNTVFACSESGALDGTLALIGQICVCVTCDSDESEVVCRTIDHCLHGLRASRWWILILRRRPGSDRSESTREWVHHCRCP